MRRLLPRTFTPLVTVLACLGCDPADVHETARAYYGELPDVEVLLRAGEMSRVMPFYVTGTVLALLLTGVAILNALEHARNLGKGEAIRFSAYLLLLCFISLFLAMEIERAWLPAGHPLPAFLATAVLGAATTSLAARARPERALLTVGYVASGLTLPLLGILLGGEVYLMDTTASLFIGFAAGLLLTIVLSDPVRGGLVDFLRRRDSSR